MSTKTLQFLGNIKPTNKALGCWIYDFDYNSVKHNDVKIALNELLLEHQLLIFRNTMINDDILNEINIDNNDINHIVSDKELYNLTNVFGKPRTHTRKNASFSLHYPEVFHISNIDKYGRYLGNDYFDFHSDLSYMPTGQTGKISALNCVHIPPNIPNFGNTIFINTYQTYNSLSDDMKHKISNMKAMHRHFNESQNPSNESVFHNVIQYHSITNKPVLYVGPLFTKYIINDNNNELLNHFNGLCFNDEFRYIHEWKKGDTLVWDNECTMHARNAYDNDQIRFMKRTQIY